MTREQHKINRLLRQVQLRLSKIETMMADPVKDEPMKVDKIALKVNNEREFKLLMKHYDSLGWLNCEGDTDGVEYFNKEKITEVTFHDKYSYLCKGSIYQSHTDLGYTVIDFPVWAAQNNVEVPRAILTSEDGIELFEGDIIYLVWDPIKGTGNYKISDDILHGKCDYTSLVFSSKEAALSWIEKENNKSTSVKLYKGGTAEVYKDRIVLHGGIYLSPSDLEDMTHALKSLK